MMDIKIYQINKRLDKKHTMFQNLAAINGQVDGSIYTGVFTGQVKADNLEDVFRIFNIAHPLGYQGRSLSVSDVVEVKEAESIAPGFYFCDSFGFEKISFQPRDTITVVLCEPGKTARAAEIGTELEDLQQAVGNGRIEPFYPFEDPTVCIVCNDEGKINGMRPCRAIYDGDKKMIDLVFGPFFICDCSGEDFGSLSKEDQEKYVNQFKNPEQYFRMNGEIIAVPYEPVQEGQQR